MSRLEIVQWTYPYTDSHNLSPADLESIATNLTDQEYKELANLADSWWENSSTEDERDKAHNIYQAALHR